MWGDSLDLVPRAWKELFIVLRQYIEDYKVASLSLMGAQLGSGTKVYYVASSNLCVEL